MRLIRTHETSEAPVASDQQAYPIVILSPGNGTNVEFYASIADEMASHGYIVVGLNHPYDVAAVLLQDGSIARFNPGPIDIQARSAWVADRVAVRTADVLFTLKQLEMLNSSDDALFGGRLGLDHVMVMGHSLGGITAAQACTEDKRILACLNLDGIQRGSPFSTAENPTPPDQPFMMITKEQNLPPGFIALFKEVTSGSYLVVIPGAAHDSFTDGQVLIPSLLPLPDAADHVLALVRSYTIAFLDQTLKGQPASILGKSTRAPDVSLDVFPAH
jgi:predicted dienelactone hydrolase